MTEKKREGGKQKRNVLLKGYNNKKRQKCNHNNTTACEIRWASQNADEDTTEINPNDESVELNELTNKYESIQKEKLEAINQATVEKHRSNRRYEELQESYTTAMERLELAEAKLIKLSESIEVMTSDSERSIRDLTERLEQEHEVALAQAVKKARDNEREIQENEKNSSLLKQREQLVREGHDKLQEELERQRVSLTSALEGEHALKLESLRESMDKAAELRVDEALSQARDDAERQLIEALKIKASKDALQHLMNLEIANSKREIQSRDLKVEELSSCISKMEVLMEEQRKIAEESESIKDAELVDVRKELDSVIVEKNEMEAKLTEKLETMNQSYESFRSDSMASAARALEKLQETESSLKSMTEKFNSTEKEMRDTIAILEEKLESMEDSLKESQQEVQDLNEKMKLMKEDAGQKLKEKTAELKKQKKEYDDLQEQMNEQKRAANSLIKTLNAKNIEEKALFEKTIDSLNGNLAISDKTNADLLEKLKEDSELAAEKLRAKETEWETVKVERDEIMKEKLSQEREAADEIQARDTAMEVLQEELRALESCRQEESEMAESRFSSQALEMERSRQEFLSQIEKLNEELGLLKEQSSAETGTLKAFVEKKTQDLSTANQNIANYQQAILKLNKTLSEQEAAYATLACDSSKSSTELQNVLDKQTEDIKKLKKLLDSKTTEHENALEDASIQKLRAQQKYEELQTVSDYQDYEIRTKNKELNELSERLQEVHKTLSEQEAAYATLACDSSKSSTELQNVLDKQTEDIKKLKKLLDSKTTEHENALEDASIQKLRAQQKYEELQTVSDYQDYEIRTKNKELNELSERLQEVHKTLSEQEAAYATLACDSSKSSTELQNVLDKQTEDIKKLKKLLDSKTTEHENALEDSSPPSSSPLFSASSPPTSSPPLPPPPLRRVPPPPPSRGMMKQIVANLKESMMRKVEHYCTDEEWTRAEIWKFVGCDGEELCAHLGRNMLEGMEWGNYGRGEGHWCMDHIVPPAHLDNLCTFEKKRMCFHYTNIKPMDFQENSFKCHHFVGFDKYCNRWDGSEWVPKEM